MLRIQNILFYFILFLYIFYFHSYFLTLCYCAYCNLFFLIFFLFLSVSLFDCLFVSLNLTYSLFINNFALMDSLSFFFIAAEASLMFTFPDTSRTVCYRRETVRVKPCLPSWRSIGNTHAILIK